MRDPVVLLWTGGYDSTFRLLQLVLVENRTVQPVYVVSKRRHSMAQEWEAMANVRVRLEERGVGDRVLPIEVRLRQDFPVPRWIADAYEESITRGVKVGKQYEWLAAVGEGLGWRDVEICIQGRDNPTIGQAEVFVDPTAEPEAIALRDTPLARLFHRYRFPVAHLRKQDMHVYAQEHGFTDILALSWYCHEPIGGRSCGYCRPCLVARERIDDLDTVPWWLSGSYRAMRRLRRLAGQLRNKLPSAPT